MEKLVLGKYLDIFSSLIGWAHVLLKKCVVKQLSVSEHLEMGEEADPLLAEQLHPLTTVGSTALKGRGKVPA